MLVNEDTYTVTGAGTIAGAEDNFRFVYQPLTQDGEIWVNIADLPTGGAGAKAGIMIRENLSSSSPYIYIGTLPDGNLKVQIRSSTGGETSIKSVAGGNAAPWVRINRKGNLFVTGYGSQPGSWSIASLENITMAPNIYIGLAVASGDPAALSQTTFNGLVVNP